MEMDSERAPWLETTWQPGRTGAMVTRMVPMGCDEARTDDARAAVEKEMQNMLQKGVFDPSPIYDWDAVRKSEPGAMVGKAKMILGVKNSEMPQTHWAYKGRLVFMGNNIRSAAGYRVDDTTEGLHGTPVGLALARMVLAVALLRDWAVQVGDVEGAYLCADLRGPPVYLRLTQALWGASGARRQAVAAKKDPCVRVRKAMYGLPRAGFDWFSHCDQVLLGLGWQRHKGIDSVCQKTDAILAVYVDDLLLAGTPHARRREWASIRKVLKMRGDPEDLSRFLGIGYKAKVAGMHTRELRASQQEYVESVVQRYDSVAAHPAGNHYAPSVNRKLRCVDPGDRADDCRSFIGALMYITRATRPDTTHAVNRLARDVTRWGRTNDADLGHLLGYLRATSDYGLTMKADVRDRKGDLRLEMWVGADHAGDEDRRSTGGWILMLIGSHGTRIAIDWASKKQVVTARSSGEAETVALNEAVSDMAGSGERSLQTAAQMAVGAKRALCAGGTPELEFLDRALGRSAPLRASVDASVC